MVKEVRPWLLTGFALTIALALLGYGILAALSAAATVAVASFFRDPRRLVHVDPRFILSPADGRIVAIVEASPGHSPGSRCVSIFLSVFNVHVNRAPVAGRVRRIVHSPGKFLPAFRPKASELNEQNLILIDTPRGPMAVKQIAGMIARRIRCWTRAGEPVGQGDKIGFITFGSRVDLFVPAGAELRVRVGDRVRGGLSVIAMWPEAGSAQ